MLTGYHGQRRFSGRKQYLLGRYHVVNRRQNRRRMPDGSFQVTWRGWYTHTAPIPVPFTVILLRDGQEFYRDTFREDPRAHAMDILWHADARAV